MLNDSINIDELIPPINSFPEYLMNEINERTIEESAITE